MTSGLFLLAMGFLLAAGLFLLVARYFFLPKPEKCVFVYIKKQLRYGSWAMHIACCNG